MENEIRKPDVYTRNQTPDVRPGPASPADGAAQRVHNTGPGFGPETRRTEGDALNLLLTNRL